MSKVGRKQVATVKLDRYQLELAIATIVYALAKSRPGDDKASFERARIERLSELKAYLEVSLRHI